MPSFFGGLTHSDQKKKFSAQPECDTWSNYQLCRSEVQDGSLDMQSNAYKQQEEWNT